MAIDIEDYRRSLHSKGLGDLMDEMLDLRDNISMNKCREKYDAVIWALNQRGRTIIKVDKKMVKHLRKY